MKKAAKKAVKKAKPAKAAKASKKSAPKKTRRRAAKKAAKKSSKKPAKRKAGKEVDEPRRQDGRELRTKTLLVTLAVRQLIPNAYQLQDNQLAGGPELADQRPLDIAARGEGADASREQLMLRALWPNASSSNMHTESRGCRRCAQLCRREAAALLGPSQRSARRARLRHALSSRDRTGLADAFER